MATKFEIRFPAGEKTFQEKAARACFEEVGRLENELSRFKPGSDVCRVAGLPPRAPGVVGFDFFECLKISMQVYQESQGAFDPSLGKMDRLALQPEALTVWVKEEGIWLDFGAIGKGHALDVCASLLLEWGCRSFLVQCGESSALGFNAEIGAQPWTVGLREASHPPVELRNKAIGGSGLVFNGLHIVDPRTGKPAQMRKAAWALAPTAAEADAYSTAFMVMDEDAIKTLLAQKNELGALLMRDNGELVKFGKGF
jgi:thiamine biosynthesis lipoprotein